MTGIRPGLILRVALSAIALFLVIRLVSGRELVAALREAQPWPLLVSIGCMVLDRVMMALKWGILLRAIGIVRPLRELVRIYLVGTFYGSFLPTGVGGDVIRVIEVARGREEIAAATASVVMERVLGLIALVLLVFLCLLAFAAVEGDRFRHLLLPVAAIFVAGILGLAWALHGRIPQRLERFAAAFRRYAGERPALRHFFGLSFLEQLLPVAANYWMSRALGLEVSFLAFLMIIPIILFVARIPISIDGLGLVEGLYVWLFAYAGLGPSESFLLALMGRVFTVLASLPGMFLRKQRPANADPAAARA
jgi:glycosyltransferase 2 family protein